LLTPAASTAVLSPVAAEEPRRRWWAYAALALATVVVFLLSLLLVKSLFKGGGAQVAVPDVRGKTVAAARTILEAQKLKVGDIEQVFSAKPVGTVVDQDPLPKFSARSGGAVNLSVSKGIEKVQVPDVRGQQIEDARTELESRGFKIGTITEKEQVGPPGRVIDVKPAPGTSVAKGSAVDLVVISGQVSVPDLFGKTFEQARAELEGLGFSNIVRQDVPTDNPDEAGTVVGQDPAKGTKAGRNDKITLQVAEAAPTTPPPSSESPTPSAAPSS
jgi:serine/threonine-protein kinase